ncbi:hypothetical protein [Methylopila sp. 73B]|uniref:hypothetical protein n=1 Tax=Methylopila sp. 73B TaxID=1120792 RepID=UPI00036D4046|nr:hypothetical protein [Methylopila sp. 73B]
MADDIPEVAPTLGVATNPEIARQALEQLRAEVGELKKELRDANAMRKSQQPLQNGSGKYSLFKDWNLTPATTILLLGMAAGSAFWVWTVSDKISEITPQANRIVTLEAANTDLKNRSSALEQQNFQYKEDRVKYREGIATQLQVMKDDIGSLTRKQEGIEYRVAQLETDRTAINSRLDRTFDIYNKRFDDNRTAAADMAGDIKVLREQTQRIITWLEARGRNPPIPFDQNQTWRGFPPRPDPFILRAVLRPVFLRGWRGSARAPF